MKKLLLLFVFFGTISYMVKAQDDPNKTLSPYFLVKGDNPKVVENMPLKETNIEANIAGVIADIKVRQIYSNTGTKPIEAIYVFPASTRAAVYYVEMTVGKRKTVAKIAEREQAREIYEQAKQEGKTASLLEQQRPNVFQMNVSNIMPNDVVTVELRYTELLIPEDGVYEFASPTVVAPRYAKQTENTGGGTEAWASNPYLVQGEKPTYQFGIQVNLNAGMPIQKITSSSHKVNVSYASASVASVKLDATEKFGGNRDYILKYSLQGEEIETGVLLYETQEENYFLLMAQPPKDVKPQQIPPREFIFVVDVSGSMYGFPLDVTKELLTELIKSLKPTDMFNVMLFSGSSEMMSPKSMTATPQNINLAIELLSRQSGGGGTEFLPALKTAFKSNTENGISRSFVIVTDGMIAVEHEAFDFIRQNLNKANLFSFGIGESVNRYLMEGMARAGSGEALIITKPSDASEKAMKFKEYIQTPALTNIQLRFEGFDAYDVEPLSPPDVLAKRPMIVFGKYRGKAQGNIKIEGVTGNGKYTESVAVAQAKSDNNVALKYLWARHKIQQINDYNFLSTEMRGKEDRLLAKEIIALSLKYNILTQYTSFVAVDDQVRTNQKATTVKQALPMPQGMANTAAGVANLTSTAQLQQESMKKTGSVTRSLGAIQVLLPTRSEFMGDKLAFKWFLKDGKLTSANLKGFKVIVTDLGDNTIFDKTVEVENAVLDLSAAELKEQPLFIVKIVPVAKDGSLAEEIASVDGNVLQRSTNEKHKAEYEALLKTLKGTETENWLKKAEFFEDRELYVDASYAFEQAIILANGAEKAEAQKRYQNFLERNGFTK